MSKCVTAGFLLAFSEATAVKLFVVTASSKNSIHRSNRDVSIKFMAFLSCLAKYNSLCLINLLHCPGVYPSYTVTRYVVCGLGMPNHIALGVFRGPLNCV